MEKCKYCETPFNPNEEREECCDGMVIKNLRANNFRLQKEVDEARYVINRYLAGGTHFKISKEWLADHPEDELPTLASLRDIAPDCTGNKSSEEFVREIRDNEWEEEK